MLPDPILAINPGQVIGLIIFTVSVISWIVNIVQSNQQNQAPRPKNRQRDPVQTELEKFLQEVMGNKEQPERKRATPPVPQQKQSRSANEKKANKAKAQQQQQRQPKTESGTSRHGERVATSHLQTSSLGQGVRSHLQEYMEPNRVEAAVKQDIDASVRRDIGSDATSDAIRRAGSVHPLALALRDPQGARQAILLNEILNRPKSLKRG